MGPYSLGYVPDCFKTVSMGPWSLGHVPDHFKTGEMCNEAVCEGPAAFFLVPDRFKTQEMCINTAKVDPWQLYDVPDWFVVLQEMWYEDFDDDHLIKWHNAYIKRKTQKAEIKKELMPIAWHPEVTDSCFKNYLIQK